MAENSTTLESRPTILCYAGPNGSGKSSITQKSQIIGLYINADEIKKRRTCTDLKAAEEAENLREWCVKETKDFTFETVLSTGRNLELLERAKKAGYYIKSIYILTTDPALNVLRIKSRVKSGGHDVPPKKIYSRYYKSLANIPRLIELCDECYIIDNTVVPEIIFAKNGLDRIFRENPYWPRKKILKLTSS
jgi:predicted ABC-type ATPase